MLHQAGVEGIFRAAVDAAIMLLETAAMITILVAAAHTLLALAHERLGRRAESADAIRRRFGRGLLLALDFAIGSDVLRVAVVPTLESAVVAAVVVLVRVAMTLVIEREIQERGPERR